MGLAFATEHAVYASEGNTGRVRLVDLATGGARKIYDLNRTASRIASPAIWRSTLTAAWSMY